MKTKVRIGGGIIIFAVFLLLGGYRYIDIGVVFPWLLAALTHEIGHYFAARLCGVKIERMTFDVIGARMSLSGKLISYVDEAVIAFAGPAVNFALAGLFFSLLPDFAEFSLMLGSLNLFPVSGFDGYRILFSVIALLKGYVAAEKVMRALSFCAVIFLWLISVYLLLRFGSGFSAFILSCSLLSGLLI